MVVVTSSERFIRDQEINPTEQHFIGAVQQIQAVLDAGARYGNWMRGMSSDYVDDIDSEEANDGLFSHQDPVEIVDEINEATERVRRKRARQTSSAVRPADAVPADKKKPEKAETGGSAGDNFDREQEKQPKGDQE